MRPAAIPSAISGAAAPRAHNASAPAKYTSSPSGSPAAAASSAGRRQRQVDEARRAMPAAGASTTTAIAKVTASRSTAPASDSSASGRPSDDDADERDERQRTQREDRCRRPPRQPRAVAQREAGDEQHERRIGDLRRERWPGATSAASTAITASARPASSAGSADEAGDTQEDRERDDHQQRAGKRRSAPRCRRRPLRGTRVWSAMSRIRSDERHGAERLGGLEQRPALDAVAHDIGQQARHVTAPSWRRVGRAGRSARSTHAASASAVMPAMMPERELVGVQLEVQRATRDERVDREARSDGDRDLLDGGAKCSSSARARPGPTQQERDRHGGPGAGNPGRSATATGRRASSTTTASGHSAPRARPARLRRGRRASRV